MPLFFRLTVGVRKCPGRYFADAGVWLALSMIISRFDISKAKDSEGNVITPVAEFESAFVRCVVVADSACLCHIICHFQTPKEIQVSYPTPNVNSFGPDERANFVT